jgi:hypothetical protein
MSELKNFGIFFYKTEMIAPLTTDVEVAIADSFKDEAGLFGYPPRSLIFWSKVDLNAMELQVMESIVRDQTHGSSHNPAVSKALIDPIANVTATKGAINDSPQGDLADKIPASAIMKPDC